MAYNELYDFIPTIIQIIQIHTFIIVMMGKQNDIDVAVITWN